ncbi:MAG: hypothetical protein WC578_07200, partial [Candidatus Omnitrophota bacterium]
VYRELRAKRIAIGDDYIDGANYTWQDTESGSGEVDFNADLVVEGNVGIGTVNPGTLLDVEAPGGSSSIQIIRAGLNGHTFGFGSSYGGSGYCGGLYSDGTLAATFCSNGGLSLGTYAASFNPPSGGLLVSGNVGIGTTAPVVKLDVTGDLRLTTHSSAPPSESGVAGEIAYASDGYLYAHNGSTWVKQGGGSTCYVDYSSAVGSCSCPSGWTLKKDLGSWGRCSASYCGAPESCSVFRPPGGACASSWSSYSFGEGCLCCSS